MTMTNVRDMLLVFGGSGPSSQFYNDLHMHDSSKSEWIKMIELTKKSQQQRAGHTCTLVDNKIYIYGGSCGKDYIDDIAIMDVFPAPEIAFDNEKGKRNIIQTLTEQINCKDFSDVTFQVEKTFYAHKIVLCEMSEHFRAMFKSGMKESQEAVIEVPNISYKSFATLMQFFYTGSIQLDVSSKNEEKVNF